MDISWELFHILVELQLLVKDPLVLSLQPHTLCLLGRVHITDNNTVYSPALERRHDPEVLIGCAFPIQTGALCHFRCLLMKPRQSEREALSKFVMFAGKEKKKSAHQR